MSALSPEEIGRKAASDVLDAAIGGHDWDWDEDEATKVIAAAIRDDRSEQEKRIAELTERVSFWQGEAGRWSGAFASERQRREEAEAALREIASAPNRIAENVRVIAACFRKYEPGK